MEMNFEEHVQERAVLVGLNADCFTKEQTATDETLEELEALLETAGGFCPNSVQRPAPHQLGANGVFTQAVVAMFIIFPQAGRRLLGNSLKFQHISFPFCQKSSQLIILPLLFT